MVIMASQSMEEEGPDPRNPLVPSLLTVLPIEIRLQIYEQVFHGSRVRVWPITPRTTWGKRLALRPSHHYQLLLVCRQIYTEARSTYWSSTVIDSALNPPFEYTKFAEVMRVIPAFAQPVIREIQCKGFTEKLRGLSFEQFVHSFARLETIVMEPNFIYVDRRCYQDSTWSSEEVINRAQRDLRPSYRFCVLVEPSGVRFLQKLQFPVVVQSRGMRVQLGARDENYPAKVRLESSSVTIFQSIADWLTPQQVFFINYSKGLVAQGTIDTPDEVGFSQVL